DQMEWRPRDNRTPANCDPKAPRRSGICASPTFRIFSLARRQWRELTIIGVAVTIALLLGYFYSVAHLGDDAATRASAQRLMGPAVNYVCTGRFGAIRLSSDATASDQAGLGKIDTFLEGRRVDDLCGSFPQHVQATSIFDRIDAPNAAQPLYLTLLYGILWHWSGPQWQIGHAIVAATVALSFLVVYFGARPFTRPTVAAAAGLLFVFDPFYITFSLPPRDGIKFPFAIAAALLIISVVTAPRRRARLLLWAAGVG